MSRVEELIKSTIFGIAINHLLFLLHARITTKKSFFSTWKTALGKFGSIIKKIIFFVRGTKKQFHSEKNVLFRKEKAASSQNHVQ